MKKILTILFIAGCTGNINPVSRQVSGPVPGPHKSGLYLNPATTNIIGNNDYAALLLSRYTHFKIGAGGRFIIDIKQDNSNDYSINQKHDTLFITGSALQGISYFLDKYCGVRFYMPTDLWTSTVKDSIIVDSINITHKPFTPVIFSTGFFTNDEGNWQVNNNLNNNSFGVTQHSMSRLFYDSSALKLYPAVYKNGFPSSIGDQNFEPDFANPQCIASSLYVASKFFIQNPTKNYISFSVMDSDNGYPAPVAGKTLSQSYTDYINTLADSFKVDFPGKFITYIIYGKVRQWPPTTIMRDNVIPILVIQLVNASNTNTAVSIEIGKYLSKMGLHDWAEGWGFIVPRIYSKILQQFLVQDYNASKIQLAFMHLEMYPNWGLDGPKYYEMGKIYDNPYINIDSMRTLFCKDMFGYAAPQMKNYLDDLEALSTSMNNNPLITRHIANYPTQMELDVTDSVCAAHARLSIDSALNEVTGIQKQRVNFFSNGFKISEGLWRIHNGDNDFIPVYQNFLKDSVANNPLYLNLVSRGNFINDMNNIINQVKK